MVFTSSYGAVNISESAKRRTYADINKTNLQYSAPYSRVEAKSPYQRDSSISPYQKVEGEKESPSFVINKMSKDNSDLAKPKKDNSPLRAVPEK